jgi:hypothetical protein
MSLGTLYIVNNSGGVIYTRALSPVPKLSGNDHLRIGSTFVSLHTIAKQLAPVQSGGIQVVESSAFSLHCLETPTGLKFFVTAAPKSQQSPRPSAQIVSAFLKEAYRLYADFALKNPFYERDMPIRAKLFDHYMDSYVVKEGLGIGGAEVAKLESKPVVTGGPLFVGSS